MIPFVVNGKWDDPEVEDIAQFRDVNQDKDNLNAFNTWNAANEFARPFSVPPGSPPQALALLRTAFKVTIEDNDYKAAAEKSKLTTNYIPGEKIDRYVAQIYSISPQAKKRLEFVARKPRTS